MCGLQIIRIASGLKEHCTFEYLVKSYCMYLKNKSSQNGVNLTSQEDSKSH